MADPFTLSQTQINALVINIALALGYLSPDSLETLDQQTLDNLKAAIETTDPTSVPDTQGLLVGRLWNCVRIYHRQ